MCHPSWERNTHLLPEFARCERRTAGRLSQRPRRWRWRQYSRTATLFRTATLSRTVLRLILPIPYCKRAQKLVANAERSCAVNVKSCSSGGTAWRRKIFRNSRVNGAPLTVFEFESIVIACICVGVCGAAALVSDLVGGLLAGTGRFSHFSMIIVLAVRLIEKSRTIFTSPLELSSQICASRRSLVSDSDHTDSRTILGQSALPGRILPGLKAESPSLDTRRVLYVVAPR